MQATALRRASSWTPSLIVSSTSTQGESGPDVYRVPPGGRPRPASPGSANETTGLGPIAEGMSNRTIAARPLVTKRTVEAHITQIFHELHPPQSADQHRRVLAVLADTPRLTRS